MGSSLSPVMAGTTYHREDIVPHRRKVHFCGVIRFGFRKADCFPPPLVRYSCSVSSSPAFRRSWSVRHTVDRNSFTSEAMVGIAGQHSTLHSVGKVGVDRYGSVRRSWRYRKSRRLIRLSHIVQRIPLKFNDLPMSLTITSSQNAVKTVKRRKPRRRIALWWGTFVLWNGENLDLTRFP